MQNGETNPELGRLILQVVENQIKENDPPETRQTVERLRTDGYTRGEAKRLVAMAVAVELFHIMKHREPFNRVRFIQNLRQLPKEPWTEGDSIS
jgi:hypothetical protein